MTIADSHYLSYRVGECRYIMAQASKSADFMAGCQGAVGDSVRGQVYTLTD
jgi:hypothetical protein